MKNLVLTTILLLIVQSLVIAQIKVNSSGNIAIGNANPNSNKLYLIGTAQLKTGTSNGIYIDNTGYSSNPAIYGCANVGKSTNCCYEVWSSYFRTCSDLRQKENIRNISNGLELVLKLNGVKFDFKNCCDLFNTLAESGKNDALIDSLRRNYVGYIAQDVIDIIPEAVGYDKSTDRYSIDYTKFIPFITEAIKEQQLIIEDLKNKISFLESDTSNLKNEVIASIEGNNSNLKSAELYQNTPNPFNQDTKIRFRISKGVKRSTINIYDLQGKQIKSYNIEERGESFITVNGYELDPGIYLYTLIADGKEIGTKRMILTDQY